MREIKFRGWHSKQKKMFSAEQMANDQLTLLTTGSFINVSGRSTLESIIYPNDKFIPLQFTGLRDKNGKEIYEGDIVVGGGTFDKTEPAEVIYKAPFFVLKTQCLTAHFDKLEIIGNIYENPELLK